MIKLFYFFILIILLFKYLRNRFIFRFILILHMLEKLIWILLFL